MTGRPDYDVGDLVVCVDDTINPLWGDLRCKKGQVYVVDYVDLTIHPNVVFGPGPTVFLKDTESASPLGFHFARFRKIDLKPPEFWTNAIDADTPEQVPA